MFKVSYLETAHCWIILFPILLNSVFQLVYLDHLCTLIIGMLGLKSSTLLFAFCLLPLFFILFLLFNSWTLPKHFLKNWFLGWGDQQALLEGPGARAQQESPPGGPVGSGCLALRLYWGGLCCPEQGVSLGASASDGTNAFWVTQSQSESGGHGPGGRKKDDKDKKKKYEPPVPTRAGRKKKKTKGLDAASKLLLETSHTPCRLELLKLEWKTLFSWGKNPLEIRNNAFEKYHPAYFSLGVALDNMQT